MRSTSGESSASHYLSQLEHQSGLRIFGLRREFPLTLRSRLARLIISIFCRIFSGFVSGFFVSDLFLDFFTDLFTEFSGFFFTKNGLEYGNHE